MRQKLLNIQHELTVTGIGKSGGSQYATRQIDVLIGVMSTMFSKHRVVLQPRIIEVHRSQLTLASGKVQQHTIVEIEYTFLDADSPEKITTRFQGEAADSLDKSLQQAITNAYKYLMIQHFQIPVEPTSDPDMYQTDDDFSEGAAATQEPQALPEKLLTDADVEALRKLMEETDTKEEMYIKFLKVDRLEDLPLNKLAGATEALMDKKSKQEEKAQTGTGFSGKRHS